jgi:hypothetical protein
VVRNFAGWWWWVGAGSSDVLPGDDEKRERKGVRAAKKEARVEKRKQSKGGVGDFLSNLWQRNQPPPPRAPEPRPGLNRVDSSSTVSTSTRDQPTSDNGSITSAAEARTPKSIIGHFASFWHVLRRAHKHAVRNQALERIRLRGGRRSAESDVNEGRPRDIAMIAMNKTSRTIDDAQNKPVATTTGAGVLWWGPFGRWRFRDRTTFN